MPVTIALFERSDDAEVAEAAIASAFARGGACLTQRHRRAPLDGNILPEGATEFGRNIAIAMVAGGVFMAIAGGLAGAFDLMLGMGVGMGVGLGFVTGLLMGLVGAMQAGTRIPKPAVRALEARLAQGGTILLVEVDAARTEAVGELLEQHGAAAIEVC